MNLSRKGLVLISIPLGSQLIFLAVLLITRRDQVDAQEWALHSKEVIARAESCHRLILQATANVRGFALVNDPVFLNAYAEAKKRIPNELEALEQVVHDNNEQVHLFEKIQSRSLDFLEWLKEIVYLLEQRRNGEAIERIQAREGSEQLLRLRKDIDVFLGEEERLDVQRRADLARAMRWQNAALITGGILALASTIALLVGFSQSISQRVGVMIENTKRLAEGRELVEPLSSSDELGTIDSMFHRMAKSIQQKEQENELFVYSVSHDLRSPLVNLQGFSQELNVIVKDLHELILESELPEVQKNRAKRLIERDANEAIGFIQSAVTRLAAIIDALLRLSRAGRVEYRAQKVDVSSVVLRIVSAMNDSLTKKQVDVVLHTLPSCWGDAAAIEQIFANLIGNSVNYLDPERPGKIEVGIVDECDGPFTTYYVKDNGLGIPAEQQDKVFIAFQRLHPKAAPGEGIGLALVRRVVERHGGTIRLESTPGVGTTMFVRLPCNKDSIPFEGTGLPSMLLM